MGSDYGHWRRMRRFLKWLRGWIVLTVAALTIGILLAFLAPGGVSFGASRPLVSAAIMAKVYKVHQCEETGNWHVNGPTYFGGLGWRVENGVQSLWLEFRAKSFPLSMADATPQQQAWAMAHFVGQTLHYWPHQGYPLSCGLGY